MQTKTIPVCKQQQQWIFSLTDLFDFWHNTLKLKAAVSELDKATKKGIYHKNTTARKVSRLTIAVNKLA